MTAYLPARQRVGRPKDKNGQEDAAAGQRLGGPARRPAGERARAPASG